jgi:peroxiredoxin
MKKAMMALAVLPMIGFLAGCSRYEPLRIGGTPKSAVLSDLEGKKVKLPDDLKGRVVLIRFWSATCPTCTEETIHAMDQLHQKYREKGFVLVSINVNPPDDVAEKFRHVGPVSFPVLVDPDGSAAKQYGAFFLPTTFILDRQGFVKEKIIGETGIDTFEPLVKRLL